MDCNPPGSSVHGILQARILEWVAISFSRGYSWPRNRTLIFCIHRQILYHWATWEAPYLSISVSKWDYHTSEHCYDSAWGAVDKGPVVGFSSKTGFQVRSLPQLTGETRKHSEWKLWVNLSLPSQVFYSLCISVVIWNSCSAYLWSI